MKRKLITALLRFLTRAIIRKYEPKIIAITGSVGKTSTKEAVYLVLSQYFPARKSEKNLNTEVGLPLAFFGGVEAKNNLWLWLKNLWLGLKLLIFNNKNYPHFIVVEMGADSPGDIKKLVKIAKPKLAIITAIGSVPVHVENYPKGKDQLISEKTEIIKCLSDADFAALNFDDPDVWELKNRTKAKIISFGFNPGADIRITDFEVKTKIAGDGFKIPDGIFFRIEHRGSVVPIWLKQSLGKPAAYAIAAAFAAGIAFDLNIIELGKAVGNYQQEKGRMRLISGIKNSMILDDSYNAAPEAMNRAIETFQNLSAKRKIAVLGDMLEIGQYALEVHREVGKKIAKFCEHLFFVGQRMKIAYEAALASEFDKNKIFWFEKSTQAAEKLKEVIQSGDLVLVKGSQGMRMELVIEEIMAEPEKAKELLVRQDKPWK
ncbi:MAG: UDP-N-acetylmuramoyl-tripeptide--D-alanyl-D-alanine ligase [Patescibacteria group bacterium]